VMHRFGNLKVGSVFSIFHPEAAVSISVFGLKRKIYIYIYIFFEN